LINGQLLLYLVYSFGSWFDIFVPFSSLIFSAFVATSLAFGCFSAAALVARRREYLYLGGLLSSGLSILMWLHFASSLFGGSIALFKFEVTINLIPRKTLLYFLVFCIIRSLAGYSFAFFAVVLWAFGVCRLRHSRYPRNYWDGSLWWPGLCEACIDTVHWFGCNLCADSYYNGEWFSSIILVFFFCSLPLNWYWNKVSVILSQLKNSSERNERKKKRRD